MGKINGSPSRHCGIGRLEIIVPLAIAGFGAQLLLPALELARETARRRHCAANLRQLGQALHQYSELNEWLPPAAFWNGDQLNLAEFPRVSDTVPATAANWAMLVLHYIEEDGLAVQFDPREPIVAHVQAAVRERWANSMRCPSDFFAEASTPYAYENVDGTKASFARGNYAINGGVQNIYEAPGTLMGPRPLGTRYLVDIERGKCQWWGTGIAGFNKSFRLELMANGLATTVLLDEVRAGIHPMDPRGAWALGQIGSSVTWGHGMIGDAGGPNPTNLNADDILRGDELHRILGADWIIQHQMTFCDHCDTNAQASSRSMHPGGVNLLFCDGASRFVTDQIDLSVWHVIHSRDTPAASLEDVWQNAHSTMRREENADERLDRAVLHIGESPQNDPQATNSIGMRLCWIPPGTFTMGLPDKGNDSNVPREVPPHLVKITNGFYMSNCEVTRGQYRTIMDSDAIERLPEVSSELGQKAGSTDEEPVSNVTWYEAAEFCKRLTDLAEERRMGRTYQLPTEAQWEYCCRSGSSVPHVHTAEWVERNDSGEIAAKGWREDPPTTTPVGSFNANAFGLYDMRGNVWEWCRDWFCRDYYSWSRTENPEGPNDGFSKVYRGADWVFTGDGCKTGSRALPPWRCSPHIGFRVVCHQRNLGNEVTQSEH